MVDLPLPNGSKIRIVESQDRLEVLIPSPERGVVSYLGFFMICIWIFMFVFSMLGKTIRFFNSSDEINLFWLMQIVFLCIFGWLAILFFWRLLRKSADEKIFLSKSDGSLEYFPGFLPLEFFYTPENYSVSPTKVFSPFSPKWIKFEEEELNTLTLRETKSGNRLTIDSGSKRTEIARNVSEVEREWIYRLIQRALS